MTISSAVLSHVTLRIAEDLRVVEADVLPSAPRCRGGCISFIVWTVEGWPLLDALGYDLSLSDVSGILQALKTQEHTTQDAG